MQQLTIGDPPPPPTEVFGYPIEVREIGSHVAAIAREAFEGMWATRPDTFETLQAPSGASVPLPRWQVPYDRRYEYPGAPRRAAPPLPMIFYPITKWLVANVDPRLNGAVVCWYDARLGHYIGPHSDRTDQLISGAPIVTVSLGAERTFRFSRKGSPSVDIQVKHGTVVVIPDETNRAVKHSLVKPRKVPIGEDFDFRRIAVTARAFRDG